MNKYGKISFVENLFKDQFSYFSLYFNYLKSINHKGNKILHLGCGWDKRDIRIRLSNVDLVSIDIDFKAIDRNLNTLKVCGDAHSFPFLEETFDYIICEDFIEHVEFPQRLFSQLSIVLKKKGEFIFTTPGGLSYIAIISRLTPISFHKRYNRIRGVESVDVYPTFYRLNSRRKITRLSGQYGFEIKKIIFVTGYPSYFGYSKILTVLFGFIHYFLSKIKFINNIFGINIFCVIKLR